MMTEILIFCFVTSLAICGLHTAGEEGYLLYPVRRFFEVANEKWLVSLSEVHKFIYYIGKPIILCSNCMGSVWGTISYLYWFENYRIGEWLFCILAISFMNGFIKQLYYRG
jgi:hypothetical protein